MRREALSPRGRIAAKCPHKDCRKMAVYTRASGYILDEYWIRLEQVVHCSHCRRLGYIIRNVHIRYYNQLKKERYELVKSKAYREKERHLGN